MTVKRGRAVAPGRQTRASLSVSRKNDCKPLPLHMQVLPLAHTPTPLHPDCATTRSQWGAQVEMSKWYPEQFLAGESLQAEPAAWRIDVQDRTYYTPDPMHGIAWVRAANHIRHRLGAVLIQN